MLLNTNTEKKYIPSLLALYKITSMIYPTTDNDLCHSHLVYWKQCKFVHWDIIPVIYQSGGLGNQNRVWIVEVQVYQDHLEV